MSITYGLIGESLSHSFSKEIHEQLADYTYELCPLTRDELDAFMREKTFKGINVTIPYKEEVIPYLDEVDPAAQAIGAVNTVLNKDGRLIGYNTDFLGMRALVNHLNLDLEGKKVGILGSGGTSKTALALAESLSAREVLRTSRSGGEGFVTYDELASVHSDIEILINTSPVGMYPKSFGQSPVDLDNFPKLEGIVDAVYNPLRTQLVLEGQNRKIPAAGGLFMLVFQAHFAVEFFLDKKIDPQLSIDIYEHLVRSKENIVLVGMPSSGKSTVGQALAESLGRPFYDSDEEIVKREGKEIPQIFEEDGEAGFREIEAAVIEDLKTLNGAVIATGGGAILRQENVDALKGNGRLYFLDRPLEDLTPTDSRPLSTTKTDLEKKYEERYDKYLTCCDVHLKAGRPVDELVCEISEDYQ